MKYIDAEKLKTEIKRLEEMDYPCDTFEQSVGFYEALNRIKSFIDSLLQEQSISSNLDEAAEDFVWEVMENDENGISELSRKLRPSSKISDYYDALAEFFKAGAKWYSQQEQLEVDLEKEIKEEYLKHRCYGGRDNMLVILNEPQFNKIAKRFIELGINTRKE